MPDETYRLLGHVPAGRETNAGIMPVAGATGYDVYLSRGRAFELPEPVETPKRVVPAVEVDAAIREVLDEFCGDSCADVGKRALLAALEDHRPRETGDPFEPDYTCSSCFYFSGDWPCSTVWRIADALGIEVADA